MSESEERAPPKVARSRIILHSLARLLRRSWSNLRESRLGTIGFVIILVFALIAILAPVIAPYPRLYLAPDADRFVVNTFTSQLPANLTYQGPIMGPTTPLSSDRLGGMWEINYNTSRGLIYMKLLRYSLSYNVTPFQNLTLSFDVTQSFNLTPIPSLPLQALYYIVPATGYVAGGQGALGNSTMNGALAFFSQRDFAVVNPFNRSVIFRYRLPFVPIWTGEDPASAGNMLIIPATLTAGQGFNQAPAGPYRYFYASDGNHTAFFEVTWANTMPYTGGHSSGVTPSGRVILVNGTLSAAPFVYYNQFGANMNLGASLNASTYYRTGPGVAMVLPFANGTVEVLDALPEVRGWVSLTLGGQPATVAGSIGYVRTSYPLVLYLPVKSATAAGIVYLDLTTLTVAHAFSLQGPDWTPLVEPNSFKGNGTYEAFYARSNDTTFVVGLDANGNVLPWFQVAIRGRVLSYFEVFQLEQVFFLLPTHKIASMSTSNTGGKVIVLSSVLPFSVVPPPTLTTIVYGGAFGGTLYGGSLSTQELNGVWTDSTTGKTTVFQFLGTSRLPLPPGTYPSGNSYLLGTDDKGEDILTQFIYGTQVAFIVGILAALFGVGIGTLVGLVAGYYGRVVDTLLMRTTDVFLVLPFLPIVLILVSIVPPSIWVIILVLAILGWPGIARVIRAQVLSLKERPFVDAARVSGASDTRLVFYHIAPNVLPFSFLYMSLGVAGAIITEAILSFLGLGDPNVTSWGGMLSRLTGAGTALYAWWWLLPPGLGITILSLGFYLLGRGFDEIINPRLRRR